jgi:hypothetical protein
MIDLYLKEYYFVAGSLPKLELGKPPEITFEEFDQLLKLNLSSYDYEQALSIRRYFALQNIRNFLNGEEHDQYGIYSEKEIEENLLTKVGYPPYVFEYLDKYENNEDRVKYMPELLSVYYYQEIQGASGFLKKYMQFERDMKRILTVFRAKKMGRNIVNELKYEDPDDPLVMQIYEQRDLKSFDPPAEYSDIKKIYEEHSNSPMDFQQALNAYRFQKIEEICGIEMFTLERILGYMIQLIMLEQWEKLNPTKGNEFIDKLIKGTT